MKKANLIQNSSNIMHSRKLFFFFLGFLDSRKNNVTNWKTIIYGNRKLKLQFLKIIVYRITKYSNLSYQVKKIGTEIRNSHL